MPLKRTAKISNTGLMRNKYWVLHVRTPQLGPMVLVSVGKNQARIVEQGLELFSE
jgi:hypothetical protein